LLYRGFEPAAERDLLDFFRDLGLIILNRWRAADLDGRAFPDIAAQALVDRPPSAHVDPMDLVRWVHRAPALPTQRDLAAKFGQPPITVFACEDFFIDVLFWIDGTTSIHQHRFSGAFHVMQGESLESTFRFRPRKRYSERLMTGDLLLQGVELHRQGDVAPIVAGTEFVHSLFHLDRPSVSVVARTPGDDVAGPQYSYSRAGLAFDPFARSDVLERRVQTLDMLRRIDSPELEAMTRESARAADAFLAFGILTSLMPRIEPHERFVQLLHDVKPAHAELIDALIAHAEIERRQRHIISRRQLAKEAGHRFFLALLLNLDNRTSILEVVRHKFPGKDPVDAMVGWLADFEKLDAINAWVGDVSKSSVSPILDVPVDEAGRRVLRDLLAGHGGAHPVSSDEERLAALMRSSLLRPLFKEAR
jgi:hypothetical protein